jgi:hypothetical protein
MPMPVKNPPLPKPPPPAPRPVPPAAPLPDFCRSLLIIHRHVVWLVVPRLLQQSDGHCGGIRCLDTSPLYGVRLFPVVSLNAYVRHSIWR